MLRDQPSRLRGSLAGEGGRPAPLVREGDASEARTLPLRSARSEPVRTRGVQDAPPERFVRLLRPAPEPTTGGLAVEVGACVARGTLLDLAPALRRIREHV